MSRKQNLYEVLGLRSDASDEDVKRTYKTLARKYHPDLNQGNPQAELAFKAVGRAYEVLGDPAKRAAYDQALRQDSDTPVGGTKVPQRKVDMVLILFGVFLALAVVFFFLDTPKGIYFLVVAVALEIRTAIEAVRTDLRRR